jgi:hypothetical protein
LYIKNRNKYSIILYHFIIKELIKTSDNKFDLLIKAFQKIFKNTKNISINYLTFITNNNYNLNYVNKFKNLENFFELNHDYYFKNPFIYYDKIIFLTGNGKYNN